MKNSKSGDVTKLPFDKYELVEMHRSDIHGADYNPRILGDEEKRRLRAILKKHGLVNPPTMNKRSEKMGWTKGSKPTLVGGHQRINQLDALHGSPNYTIQVALIDVNETDEIELNLALNNPSAQGDWDLEKLEELLTNKNLDLAGTGFDSGDVFRLFGDMPGVQSTGIDELSEKLRAFQESYTNVSDNVGRDDFYLVVIFPDYARRTQFLEALKLQDNRYQDGGTLMKLLKGEEPIAPATAPAEDKKSPLAEEPPAGKKRKAKEKSTS